MGGAYELAFSIYMYMNPYKSKMLYIHTETLLKRTIIYLLFFFSAWLSSGYFLVIVYVPVQ